MTSKEILELIDAYLWEIQEGKDVPSAEDILLDLKAHIKENSLIDIEMNKQGLVKISDLIQKDLEILEIIKNKLVFPLALMSLPYELYNKSVMKEQQLTQEEYDKIKGWLKNE